MLRIDINLLFTVINVLVLFVAVRIFLWKPIHRILEARQAEAETTLKQAEEKRAEAEVLAARHQQQLDAIAQERTAVMEEAHVHAQAESQRILDAARAQAQEILTEADAAAERRRDDTLREAHAQISEIIMTAAAKITGAGGDSDLYDEFLQKAGKKDE